MGVDVSSAARAELKKNMAQDVLQSRADPYPELDTALDAIICKVLQLPCADPGVDWAKIISEAVTLRHQHED